MVANSQLVVVGRLVEFDGKELADERTGRAATFAVESTLKGQYRDRLRVQMFHPVSDLTRWKNDAGRLLLVARGNPPAETGMIDLADKDLQVLTADFKLLRKPDEVIRAANEAVRRMPGVMRIKSVTLEVPIEVVMGTKWEEYYRSGGNIRLTVPIDERLERRALEYVRSKDFSQRADGVLILRHFKSDENIARVKLLLNDPQWAYLGHAEYNKGIETRVYLVRKYAYGTLKYWGVGVEKPLIREELWKPDLVQTADLSNRKVTDADLKDLRRFKSLRSVFFLNADMTDERLKDLAGLTNLHELYLGGTQVTNAGLMHLAALTKLQFLDLASTQVTDEGLKVLAGFKSLQKLDLKGTQVTTEGTAELHKLRPELKIVR